MLSVLKMWKKTTVEALFFMPKSFFFNKNTLD
jgi:hypothetical protein